MGFIRLEFLFQNSALLKQVSQARHHHRVEHVNLEEEAIPDMVAIERYTLDKGDARDESRIEALLVSSKTHG